MPVTQTVNVYLYGEGIIIEIEVGTQEGNIFEVYNEAGDLISVEDSLEAAREKLLSEGLIVDAVFSVLVGIALVSIITIGVTGCLLG